VDHSGTTRQRGVNQRAWLYAAQAMKRTVLLATLMCTLLVSAASGQASMPARDGRVVGVIRLCGGPAPGRCFTQDGVVLALNDQHQIVVSHHTQHAAFSFELPAGIYTLEAKTGGTRGKQTVLIRRGKTTTANVVIPIP
jgi:hypothetical protein